MATRILRGDVRVRLAELADESVHCVVTSPPYWGLRDYGMLEQIGAEETPQEFVEVLVGIFREVRRVLRSDGTAWVNLGDSYASTPPGNTKTGVEKWASSGLHGAVSAAYAETLDASVSKKRNTITGGLKPKDLCGIPWRVAFALQSDGWWLRQDIIWAKPNPMPESVRDRCTKSHEYIFLLAKSERYYFDQGSILEPVAPASVARLSQPTLDEQAGSDRVPGKTNGPMKAVARKGADESRGDGDKWNENNGRGFLVKRSGNKERKDATERGCPESGVDGSIPWEGTERNKRSVWTVTTQPFKEAHFATFPPALIEPCILAGCPPGGVVLDPFGGAGTTGLVADRLQRDAILIELNPEYADMAERRIRGDSPLFAQVGT